MKRILVIQDFSVFGKTGGSVSVSILSSMGIEVVFVPVNVYFSSWDSVENGYGMCQKTDLSGSLDRYSGRFTEDKIHFDCIFVSGGFSSEQILKIDNLVNCCLTDDCLFILNMSCLHGNFSFFKNLYEKADVLITDLKQVPLFSGSDWGGDFKDKFFVEHALKDCRKIIKASIVVTGFYISDKKGCIVLSERNKDDFRWFYHNNYNCGFYGLNDIFAAVTAGAALNRMSLEESLKLGIDFTEKAVKNTLAEPARSWYGADFESIIWQLSGNLP